MVYEGLFKFLHHKLEYHIIYKNGTNDNVSIDHPKAAYLEGNPSGVEFPPLRLKDTGLTITMPFLTINN